MGSKNMMVWGGLIGFRVLETLILSTSGQNDSNLTYFLAKISLRALIQGVSLVWSHI